MIKCICYKTYNGWTTFNNSFVYQKQSGESNFCIEKGTILYIGIDDGYINIYKEDGKPLCYMCYTTIYKEYFIPLAEWREQKMKDILEDE